jgi:small-conductance mechanosensitive channel/CRP-like cAMP-binding protein
MRHLVILFGMQLVALGLRYAFWLAAAKTWEPVADAGADLLATLTVVNLFAVVVFDLGFGLLRIEVSNIILDLVIGAAWLFSLFHTLHGHDVNLSGLIATSAVVSGVLSLALAPTIGNILGGVAIQVDNSVHEGDWIQLGDMSGKVKEIRWRHTVIETRNWDTVIVPNATLLNSNIVILGKRAGEARQHRQWVYFNVDFRYPPGEVIGVVNDALQLAPIPNVAHEPAPHAICMDFAKDNRDSFAYYAVRYWLTDLAKDDPTNSVVRERIYTSLKRAGIPLALPSVAAYHAPNEEEHRARKHEHDLIPRVGLLQQIETFKSFTVEELQHLAERLSFAPFAAGEVMTQQGRPAHWLYILVSGAAKVTVQVGQDHKEVNTLHAPNIFGEFSVLTGEHREATVVATCPSECFRLDKDAFKKILTERPELAQAVSTVMATRRAELIAVRDSLDHDQKYKTMVRERDRVLDQIERFFGLADEEKK